MKDPKQILESFRTDVQSRNLYSSLLRQFDLEYPNPRGNRRKPKPLAGKNVNQMAAALSVCLVTGLLAGVGTAFANSDLDPANIRWMSLRANRTRKSSNRSPKEKNWKENCRTNRWNWKIR